jgi:DNA invertase Pin-like site-specific DNA recombinase
MRIAIYSRVSTSGKGQDTEVQARELREYAAHRNWQIVKEFSDSGVSGSTESRPALDEMMRSAKRRAFDGILIWKLDRIGRSLKHLVNLLAELEALGVALVSFSDNLDLSTPQGKLMFQIIGAMAEFERSLIQERVRAGLRNARSKGVRLGRPRAHVEMSELLKLRNAGMTLRQIADQTKISPATVLALLRKQTGYSVGTVFRSLKQMGV